MWYCGTVPPRIITLVMILTKLVRGLSLVSASAVMYMYIYIQVHDINTIIHHMYIHVHDCEMHLMNIADHFASRRL